MANEYQLSYTASEINEKLGKIDNKVDADDLLQSDWNQNDETHSDYIKNKPFYQGEGVIFEEQTIAPFEEWEEGIFGYSEIIESHLQIGEKYTVIWDGVKYENLVCYDDDEIPTIGSPYSNISEYPFCIYTLEDEGIFIEFATNDITNTSHTVSITGKKIFKLEEKYIPNSVLKSINDAMTVAEDAMTVAEDAKVMADEAKATVAGQWKIGGYVPAGTTGIFELTVPRFTELKTFGYFKNTNSSSDKTVGVFVNGYGLSQNPFIRKNTHDTARWHIQVEETPYIDFLNATIGGKLFINNAVYDVEQHSTTAVPTGFMTDNNTIKFDFGEGVSVMNYTLTIYYR